MFHVAQLITPVSFARASLLTGTMVFWGKVSRILSSAYGFQREIKMQNSVMPYLDAIQVRGNIIRL